MLRLIAFCTAGLLVCAGIFVSLDSATAANEAVPDTETIMKKLNKKRGEVGLHPRLQPMLGAEKIDWEAVTPMAKEYSELASALGKNNCPKGNTASWDKLCKSYAQDAKALEAAASKKDKSAAVAAFEKLNKSCQSCHDEHR
jgi:cytochrome c556